jgi:hypothetical protein
MNKPTTRAPPARRRPRQPRHRPLPTVRGPIGVAVAAAPDAPAFIERSERRGMIAEAEGSRAEAGVFDCVDEVDAGLAPLKDVEHPLPLPSAAPFAGR